MDAARTLPAIVIALLCACSSDHPSDPGGGGSAPSDGSKTSSPAKPPPADDPPSPDPSDGPNVGPCTGQPGELYALSVRKLSATDEVPLCRFKGQVLLIVNVASQCGYTPQYKPLQGLFMTYASRGFYVLGFPSKSFAQEFSDEKDVSAFCTTEYNITFPMFAIGNVNPPDEQPVYTWLKSQPGQSADVAWNFEKFLVSRQGKVVGRFLSAVEPDAPELTAAIEAELAKP
jgi:glutathione peroxidase